MAIALDATSNAADSSGTTLTFSHTCTGSDLVLVVFATTQSGTAATVTYNGVAMTRRAYESATNPRIGAYVLADPATGAHDIVVTTDNDIATAASGISFTGAQDYSAVATATNTSTSASITVTTAESVGFVTVGIIATNPTSLTYTGGGTAFGAQDIGANKFSSSYKAYSAGADVTETWTLGASQDWHMAGVEIYQVPDPFKPIIMSF